MNWIVLIIAFILGAISMFMMVCIPYAAKQEEPVNRVHFYVTRDSDQLSEGLLNLWINKPGRGVDIWYAGKSWARHIAAGSNLELFGLNLSDYDNLKWEDEPKEVFLNLED